jgi:hypothetical protein
MIRTIFDFLMPLIAFYGFFMAVQYPIVAVLVVLAIIGILVIWNIIDAIFSVGNFAERIINHIDKTID